MARVNVALSAPPPLVAQGSSSRLLVQSSLQPPLGYLKPWHSFGSLYSRLQDPLIQSSIHYPREKQQQCAVPCGKDPAAATDPSLSTISEIAQEQLQGSQSNKYKIIGVIMQSTQKSHA